MSDVAAGRSDAYVYTSHYMKLWDTAPGACIIEEAGGKVTDMKGAPLRYDPSVIVHELGILVSNSLVHDMLIEKYKEFVCS